MNNKNIQIYVWSIFGIGATLAIALLLAIFFDISPTTFVAGVALAFGVIGRVKDLLGE